MRKVDQEVLVTWVYAMLGKVCGIGIVDKIVQGRDYGAGKEFGEGEFARGIKRRVDTDGKEGCQESDCSEED